VDSAFDKYLKVGDLIVSLSARIVPEDDEFPSDLQVRDVAIEMAHKKLVNDQLPQLVAFATANDEPTSEVIEALHLDGALTAWEATYLYIDSALTRPEARHQTELELLTADGDIEWSTESDDFSAGCDPNEQSDDESKLFYDLWQAANALTQQDCQLIRHILLELGVPQIVLDN
jgi:hypothetical protein